MHRRSFAWVVAGVFALAGTQVAHALAYEIAAAGPRQQALLLEETGHGYLSYLPFALALATAIVALALVSEVRMTIAGAVTRRPSFWPFAALAPLLFACQEHFERLLHDGSFPWTAVTERTFVFGLLLQVPFAVAAYAIARLLLVVAALVGRLLEPELPRYGGALRRVARRPQSCPWGAALTLALGPRGPPRLRR